MTVDSATGFGVKLSVTDADPGVFTVAPFGLAVAVESGTGVLWKIEMRIGLDKMAVTRIPTNPIKATHTSVGIFFREDVDFGMQLARSFGSKGHYNQLVAKVR